MLATASLLENHAVARDLRELVHVQAGRTLGRLFGLRVTYVGREVVRGVLVGQADAAVHLRTRRARSKDSGEGRRAVWSAEGHGRRGWEQKP